MWERVSRGPLTASMRREADGWQARSTRDAAVDKRRIVFDGIGEPTRILEKYRRRRQNGIPWGKGALGPKTETGCQALRYFWSAL
jgi:hypothetical protein